MSDDRQTVVRRIGAVILIANLILMAAKSGVWLVSGSLAVGSEAVNSLTDSAYSLVILTGLYLTTQPPDFKHPHGHERIEPFVSLVVAAGIFTAGGAVLWNAAETIQAGAYDAEANIIAVVVLIGTAGVKYVLYRYCRHVGDEQHSPAVTAVALDNRNDILTAGAALIGVLGSSIGIPVLDPIAAVVVSVGIFYTGYEIVRDNISYLVGAAPPEALRREILEEALRHPDVRGAHDVIAHYVGPEVDVSLHIEVEGNLTLTEAHNIESAVVESVEDLRSVDDAFVHVDPRELNEWKDDPDADRLVKERHVSDDSG
ncbi:cation diffusion facilitator family transporter [Haloquadratum walsbyi]|jgi:cation diffusion facilitator family transporter|uniref:Cation diffusion facilitator family transporter n=1 Tax=Haloquadratum walsbyi J07HQW2 TaxID=1238425 RepID=U1NEE5_9EURY|nr:cation diffusion facilitator family transporter [Haloquadratum walsbyi]ERG95365.1 MAG: cation diffusion facilitator family transporter [Haloquadratum walsbyi J07HQW2]